MKEKRRILFIVGGMGLGGAETFIMKMFRNIPVDDFVFDFLVSEQDNFYSEEISALGGEIFYTVPKKSHPIKAFINLYNVVRKHDYKIVVRISQHSLAGFDLLISKLAGATVTVFRSSNTDCGGGVIPKLLHKLMKWVPSWFSTVKIAPSTEAANFMYFRRYIKKDKVLLLKNGLDINDYSFSNDERITFRNEIGASDSTVYGHIGRFVDQKNHDFLIDVFNDITKIQPNSKLVLVGEGILKASIIKKIHDLQLDNKVVLLGASNNVRMLMSGFDALIFPSLYEGLPNVIVEAQTSGLQCFLASSITNEIQITDLVSFYSLGDSSLVWANQILKDTRGDNVRSKYKECVREKGYDIKTVTSEFLSSISSKGGKSL